MRSSTSSSEVGFIAALVVTFAVLTTSWELVLRQRGSASVDLAIRKPDAAVATAPHEEWLVFGNCLMMTGVATERLNEQLPRGVERQIVNIANHEQSPIAYFDYLRRHGHYPAVVITNISSWINGTNFEQEAALVARVDPLDLSKETDPARAPDSRENGARDSTFQQRTEASLTRWTADHSRALGHKYHLFDYMLFLGSLLSTADLDTALYQLNMQSWFTVTSSETDGHGYLGLQVRYRDDWEAGLDRMAERSVQRLRLTRLLTDRYWMLLEDHVRHFREHGTEVVFVRMPEHPKIRAFNDETYELPLRLRSMEERTGASVLDLSRLGPSDGVRLFDAVHPDAPAAAVITRELAAWLRARRLTVLEPAGRPRGPDAMSAGAP